MVMNLLIYQITFIDDLPYILESSAVQQGQRLGLESVHSLALQPVIFTMCYNVRSIKK